MDVFVKTLLHWQNFSSLLENKLYEESYKKLGKENFYMDTKLNFSTTSEIEGFENFDFSQMGGNMFNQSRSGESFNRGMTSGRRNENLESFFSSKIPITVYLSAFIFIVLPTAEVVGNNSFFIYVPITHIFCLFSISIYSINLPSCTE